jgi:hypothetical protein
MYIANFLAFVFTGYPCPMPQLDDLDSHVTVVDISHKDMLNPDNEQFFRSSDGFAVVFAVTDNASLGPARDALKYIHKIKGGMWGHKYGTPCRAQLVQQSLARRSVLFGKTRRLSVRLLPKRDELLYTPPPLLLVSCNRAWCGKQ